MSVARTRIRRFKPHGSPFWVVAIHESEGNSNRAYALTRVREAVMRQGETIQGFAIVLWDEWNSVCDFESFDSRIPEILVPDYVRNRLLAHKILREARDRA